MLSLRRSSPAEPQYRAEGCCCKEQLKNILPPKCSSPRREAPRERLRIWERSGLWACSPARGPASFAIAWREIVWRHIPAEFGKDGWYARHERHVIYWKLLPDGAVGVVTILHQRVCQLDRFREDLGEA